MKIKFTPKKYLSIRFGESDEEYYLLIRVNGEITFTGFSQPSFTVLKWFVSV